MKWMWITARKDSVQAFPFTLLKYIRKVTGNGNRQVTCEVNLYGPSQGKP